MHGLRTFVLKGSAGLLCESGNEDKTRETCCLHMNIGLKQQG